MNPIVLLHGALGSTTQLHSLAEKFKSVGREIFSFNFSGHGGTAFSGNEFGIDTFSKELLSFLDSQQIQRADIFGYSMGGYVALWAAHLHPDRIGKMVTLGTKFDWTPESAEKDIRKLNPQKIEEKVPSFALTLKERHAPNDWREVLMKTAEMMKRLGQQPLLTEHILDQVKSPVHILLGDQDETVDLNFSKQVVTWLPFGKFVSLPNTPHPIEKVMSNFIIDAMLK
ncbi:MAG TPA: alpha/beta fold hydrolase [Cyclobacteriaceae bacterium]|jgi:pimeloyl-ACP methyl ester carboxylesterase|nr:alpha/beta fold hydrolase [Cyclobacteriaceae bacterium]